MLILVYGVPKSASTFATAIARAMVQSAGHDQAALRDKHIPGDDKTGFIVDLEVLSAIADTLPDTDIIVLKTHSSRDKTVEALEARGVLRSIATYRDPRDAALSAFEAAEKARTSNDQRQGFFQLESLDDAINFTIRHVDLVALPWLLAPGVLKLNYDFLTQTSEDAALKIAHHLGLEPKAAAHAARHLLSGKKRVYNFNVGESGRYINAFSTAQLETVDRRAGGYVRFCAGDHAALAQSSRKLPLRELERRVRHRLDDCVARRFWQWCLNAVSRFGRG